MRFTVPFTSAVNGSYWEHRVCALRDIQFGRGQNTWLGWSDPTSLPREPWRSLQPSEQGKSLFTMCFARVQLGQEEIWKREIMSIINRTAEMVKREYELQEPIAVAVEKYATFIQSTPDHVVNSALKIVIWRDVAGASNSKHKPTERMSLPRQKRRGHDSTNPPFEALPRLPSLDGCGNGGLL